MRPPSVEPVGQVRHRDRHRRNGAAARLGAGIALALLVATSGAEAADGGPRSEGDAAAAGRRRGEASAAVAVGRTVSVRLVARNASGVVGWTVLTADGVRTIVAISVEGTATGLPAHIHAGRCDARDSVPAFPLTDVYPGRPTTTTVELRLDDLLDGTYAIDVHRASPTWAALQDPSSVVACGEIPGDGGASMVGPRGGDWVVGARQEPARVRSERRR